LLRASNVKFFGKQTQTALASDEVYDLDSQVALDSKQELLQENRAAGAACGYGEVLGN